MKYMRKTVTFLLLPLLVACSESISTWNDGEKRQEIVLSAEYPVTSLTRTTANGFTDGDQVGIFVVDYENGEAGTMALNGNRASNVVLTFDEQANKWTALRPLYWAEDGTPSDIIGYYPFVETLESTTSQTIAVKRNQHDSATKTGKGGFEQSDLLWAKAEKVSPTSETVVLKYQHIMAGLNIRIERGDGFTAEEWAQMQKTVLVTNTLLSGTADLTKGVVVPQSESGERQTITAMPYGDAWRAVVIPQTVEAGKALLGITVDGQNYNLTKTETMTYVKGKMHNFTISVNRRTAAGDYEFKLLDEAIVPWEVDANLHDGLTRAYTVVNVAKPGTLRTTMVQMGIDYSLVANLKVVGTINKADLELMGKEMGLLTNLNLSDAVIKEGVITGFKNNKLLHHISLPEKDLKEIGEMAFYNSGLSGNLIIPEGVERISRNAFERCNFTGSLSLPSTLAFIGGEAFSDNKFTGELRLPEHVVFEENSRESHFWGCNFSGTIQFPKTERYYFNLGFENVVGDIIIPQGVKEILSPTNPMGFSRGWSWGAFSEGGYDGVVVIPEGVIHIGEATFAETKIRGEVKLPSTLKLLGNYTFDGTRISKIIFNDHLSSIGEGCFRDCHYLSGTLEWPRKCNRVSDGVFENCTLLSGIALHKDVKVIGDNAFLRCSNLTSIVCEGEEPPLVGDDAFLGVSKANAVVTVPPTAVARYKEAEGWRDFSRIVATNDFDVQPAKVCALNNEHQETLVLYSDGPWTVEHYPDWCKLSKSNGTGKSEVIVTVSQLNHGRGQRQDSIVFRQNVSGYTTYCKVSQYDYQYEEDACLMLQKHSRGGGIDIVFVGDGWDGKGISNGNYIELVKYQTECFFAIEPYRSMRDYFNVYVTFPLSQETGVNTMYTYVNNRFGTLHGASSTGTTFEKTCLMTESDELYNYVAKHVTQVSNIDRCLIVLVPNSAEYAGNTILDEHGRAIAICPPSENAYPRDTRGTIQHEAGGHGFGKLGDETITQNAFARDEVKWEIREMQWRGWYQNLSVSGKMNEVPWAEYIFDPAYSDRVDVFEGGYGYTRGIYRSEANSCMNYGIPYYNTPSRLAIWKRIKQYAGEGWTKEEFRAQDTFEWGPTEVTRSQTIPAFGLGYAESNRHVAPAVMNFKKMGREVRKIREKVKVKSEKLKR